MKKVMMLVALAVMLLTIGGCGKVIEETGDGAVVSGSVQEVEKEILSEIEQLPTEVVEEPVEDSVEEWQEDGEAHLAILGQQSASHSKIPGVSTLFVLETPCDYELDLEQTTFKGIVCADDENVNIDFEIYELDEQVDAEMLDCWRRYLIRVTTQGEEYDVSDLVFTTVREDDGVKYYAKSEVIDADDMLFETSYGNPYALLRIEGNYYVIDNNISTGVQGNDSIGTAVLTKDRVLFVSDGGSIDALFYALANNCGYSIEPYDTPAYMDECSLEVRSDGDGNNELWYTYEIYDEDDDDWEECPYIVYSTDEAFYAIKMF